MVEIKRNTTPTLPVVIETYLRDVKKLEFIFKRTSDPLAKTLVYKKHIVGEEGPIRIKEDQEDAKEFTVLMNLTADETMKLLAGEAYMDTRIVFKDGTVPQTDIVPVRIKETLFGEVYTDDEGEGQN